MFSKAFSVYWKSQGIRLQHMSNCPSPELHLESAAMMLSPEWTLSEPVAQYTLIIDASSSPFECTLMLMWQGAPRCVPSVLPLTACWLCGPWPRCILTRQCKRPDKGNSSSLERDIGGGGADVHFVIENWSVVIWVSLSSYCSAWTVNPLV